MNNMYPGFESYNMMSFPYPNGPIMYPNNMNTCSNKDNRIDNMQKQIDNLMNRVSRLESSMYPEALDYPKTNYQGM